MDLLYPAGKERCTSLSKDTYQNLALDELVDMIGITDEEKKLVSGVISVIPEDIDTIRYRQEILRELVSKEEFCSSLEKILQKLDMLSEYKANNRFILAKKSSLWDLIDYMSEMDIYIQIIEALSELFESSHVSSRGLLEIEGILRDVIVVDKVSRLKDIVYSLKTEITGIKSINIGMNLTPELKPEEIIVLGYKCDRYPSKLFDDDGKQRKVERREPPRYNPYGEPPRYSEATQFMKYVGEDMEKRLSRSVQRYKKELKKYINLNGYFLLDICDDLRFYLLVARYARKLKGLGHSYCFPDINDSTESVRINGIYNIRLVQKGVENIVTNDFSFSDKDKVFILTGPNRGGKTMLTQAVGTACIMASLGLFVPADSYEGYVFNNVLTHFPVEENTNLELGRLGEEAIRVKRIAMEADKRTLVLLNETYSSTSAEDGLYLARDLVHILKHNEIPTIFNTHLHELARGVEEMNEWEGRGDVISLVMEIVDNNNTYKVLRKKPDGNSYARNIAAKYGVTYEQMLTRIK